jgi:hypothetical protein
MKNFAQISQKCLGSSGGIEKNHKDFKCLVGIKSWRTNCICIMSMMSAMMKNLVLVALILMSIGVESLQAQLGLEASLDQARRLYERISGLPPTDAEVVEMAELIANRRTDEAAFIAMQNSGFFAITLKNMFSPLSNEEKIVDFPLTDFTATVAGLVRDNEPFHQILHADVIYTASDALQTYSQTFDGNLQNSNNPASRLRRDNNNFNNAPPAGSVRPIIRADFRYIDNAHYNDLESLGLDWSRPDRLVRRAQSESIYSSNYIVNNERVSLEDIAGLLTTRQFSSAAYSAGTNRRPYAMLVENFLCRSLESMHNIHLPDTFVRQDIDRSPAGDDMAFQTQCAGCHAQMDAASGAFVYLNFVNDRTFWQSDNLPVTNDKLFRLDAVYPAGHRPTNNSWRNYFRPPYVSEGAEASLGFRTINGVQSIEDGVGVKSLGLMMASSEAFSECMVERVFEQICFRNFKAEATPNEKIMAKQMARKFEAGVSTYDSFEASGAYNLKAVFAMVSNLCFGNE